MALQSWLVVATFVATIAGLIRFQDKPAAVFGCGLLFIFGGGLVTQEQVLASVVNPGLATLILLIVCSQALEKTRLLRLVAARVIKPKLGQTWLRLFGATVLSSALLNNTAVVATLLAPVRNNPYHSASRLLLPLSYAAILGGTLTLVGTSTNLIVNSLLIDTTGEALQFFDFTAVGLLAMIGGAVVLALTTRWLPDTKVTQQDFHKYFIDAKVQPGSELVGRSVEENGLRHLESLFLVEIVRKDRLISPVGPADVVEEGDRLVFSGDVNKLMQLNQFSGLTMFADQNGLLGSNLTEVVIRPESVLIGSSLKDAGFRARFDAAVVAVRRDGVRLSGKLGDVELRAGDFLVLAVGDDFRSRNNLTRNFIVVSGVEPESRLTGKKEWLAIGGFGLAILLAAVGWLSLFKGMVILLGGLLLTRSLTVNEILRRLPIDIWLIVASALVLSSALTNTGMVDVMASHLNGNLSADNTYLAFVATYLFTVVLTELVTNNAAAALAFPLGFGFASALGVSPMPFVMAVAFGASSSFISPYGYQTNLMVYNSGHYRLIDFVRIGVPLALVYGTVVLIAIPYFFPF